MFRVVMNDESPSHTSFFHVYSTLFSIHLHINCDTSFNFDLIWPENLLPHLCCVFYMICGKRQIGLLIAFFLTLFHIWQIMTFLSCHHSTVLFECPCRFSFLYMWFVSFPFPYFWLSLEVGCLKFLFTFTNGAYYTLIYTQEGLTN